MQKRPPVTGANDRETRTPSTIPVHTSAHRARSSQRPRLLTGRVWAHTYCTACAGCDPQVRAYILCVYHDFAAFDGYIVVIRGGASSAHEAVTGLPQSRGRPPNAISSENHRVDDARRVSAIQSVWIRDMVVSPTPVNISHTVS